MKNVLIVLSIIICFTFSNINNSFFFRVGDNSSQFLKSTKGFYPFEEHKYELVFENGVWMVYEYNEDGELINIYPLST